MYSDDNTEHTADSKETPLIKLTLPGWTKISIYSISNVVTENLPVFYPNSPGLILWKGWVGLMIIFFFYEIPIYISFDRDVWDVYIKVI